MKKFIVIVLCSLSATVFAKESSQLFQSTGTAECNEQDCSAAVKEAQEVATDRAQQICGSLPSTQVSAWRIARGFGIVRTTATFKCGEKEEMKDYFSSTGSADCETDCSQAELEAQEKATERAEQICGALTANRVSKWTTRVSGFGRLWSTAIFVCEN